MLIKLLFSMVLFIAGATSAAWAATITEYPLPIGSANAQPNAITAGPDGRLWFTEGAGNRIGAISTGGMIQEYGLPTAGSLPSSIAKGLDGNLWFTQQAVGKIGQITTTGIVQEFPILGGGQPFSITPGAGADPNLYFTSLDGTVRRISLAGTFTSFPGYSYPGGLRGIVATAAGVVWVANQTTGSIDRLDFSTGQVIQYFLLNRLGQPQGMTLGPDGNVWFTEQIGKIGRITPSGGISEYTIPTIDSFPGSITAGPDGNLWFTGNLQNTIGRITPLGVITEFALPTPSSQPVGITAGPDGKLWFAQFAANRIGRLDPVASPCTIPDVTISNSSWKTSSQSGGASVVWLNAAITKLKGISANVVSTTLFSGVQLKVDGVTYPLPDGLLIFDPNAAANSTIFANGRWETTVNPAIPTSEQFMFGAAIPVSANLANGKKAAVSFNLSSSQVGWSLDWKFGEAFYNTWPSNWNAALISPTKGVQRAGSPLDPQTQQALIGGGSDFNGQQSSTGSASCLLN